MVKCLATMWKTQVWPLDWEDPLEKEMATHSSTLSWKIPWMEEPDRLQSMGSWRVRHNWATSLSLHLYIYINISFHTYFISHTHTHTHTHTQTRLCSVAQSCLTLWSFGLWSTRLLCPRDFPGKSTGAVVISSSRGSFWPRDWTSISYLSRQILYHWAPWENLQTHIHTLFGEE